MQQPGSAGASTDLGAMSHTVLVVQPRGQKAELMLTQSVNECIEVIVKCRQNT